MWRSWGIEWTPNIVFWMGVDPANPRKRPGQTEEIDHFGQITHFFDGAKGSLCKFSSKNGKISGRMNDQKFILTMWQMAFEIFKIHPKHPFPTTDPYFREKSNLKNSGQLLQDSS